MSNRDDPFDDLFREIERMMNEMIGGNTNVSVRTGPDSGFGQDTHVDIHEHEGEIRVIADLPGVEKDDIQLQCDGRTLTVHAASDRREYDEHIKLPGRVDETTANATYNNGVLEVVFDRTDQRSNINVE